MKSGCRIQLRLEQEVRVDASGELVSPRAVGEREGRRVDVLRIVPVVPQLGSHHEVGCRLVVQTDGGFEVATGVGDVAAATRAPSSSANHSKRAPNCQQSLIS